MKKIKAVLVLILIISVSVAGLSVWRWYVPRDQTLQSTASETKQLGEESVVKKTIQDGKENEFTAAPKAVSTEKSVVEAVFRAEEFELGCSFCHDEDQTKSFHVPEKIIKIEARKGLRRRLCPDCHGLEGANPNNQMTDPRYIQFDPNASENGLYRLDKGVPHAIHKERLISGKMECIACHLKDANDQTTFNMIIPEADTKSGQILLCQNCKFHPEQGNYIAIHVEVAGKTCKTCHSGDLLEIHKRATAKLGLP